MNPPSQMQVRGTAASADLSAEAGIALALAGRYVESVKMLQEVLSYAPANVLARAYLGMALHGAARHAEAREVLDYEGGVVCGELQPEAQREQLNRALSAFIQGHPSLKWEPPGKATHGGWQSGELLNDTAHIAATFKRLLHAAIGKLFMLHCETNEEMAPLHLSAWGLCLSSGGFQEPHVHQAAILSGVYYVSVPAMRGPQHAGGLRFSNSLPWLPSMPTGECSTPHIVIPEEGLLVLFPAYFWHETIPFESEAPRISVAFDLIPLVDREG